METALVETERDVLRRWVRRPLARVLEAGCGRRVAAVERANRQKSPVWPAVRPS